MKLRRSRAAAAGPISTRRLVSSSTTATICCCQAITRRSTISTGSARAGRCTIRAPRSSTSRTSRVASAGGSISARAASHGGCSIRKKRVPGTTLGEYLAPLGVFVKGSSATVGEAMRCEGPLYERLWRPLLTSALNTDPPESSASLTASLLRETLAAGGKACHPLFAAHGLANSFIDPALAFLAARGSPVRFADRLKAVRFEENRAVELDFDRTQQELGANDSVILSVPPWIAQDLLPDLTAPDEFRGILNVHFQIAPPRGQPAILGVVNAEIEWLFAFPDRLSVTISNADRLIDRPRDELAAEIWREAAALDRTSYRAAAVADRQGEAGDLRGDAGAERQTAGSAYTMASMLSWLATGSRPACRPRSKARCVRAIRRLRSLLPRARMRRAAAA